MGTSGRPDDDRNGIDDGLTRRALIRKSGLSALALAGVPAVLSACGGSSSSSTGTSATGTAKAAAKPGGSITVASWGGSYNDDLNKYFGEPFTQETGIKVRFVSNTSLAGLKRQVAAGAVQWDIAELSGADYQIGVKQDVGMEPLDFSIIDKTNIPSYAVGDYGIQYAYFTQVMGWDKRQVKSPPTSWAEFFDPDRYQVKRSLYDAIYDSFILEFALLADGVPRDSIYPLDVDRALKSLERLPADKMIWYSTNQQVIQQLSDRESRLAMPYTGRVRIAAADGIPLDYTTTDGGALGDYFVVPKGAKNAQGAMMFINYICTNVDNAAAFMKSTAYGVSNLKAVEALPADIKAIIPTNPAMQDKILMRDDKWWADNLETVTPKFQAWQAKYSG